MNKIDLFVKFNDKIYFYDFILTFYIDNIYI